MKKDVTTIVLQTTDLITIPEAARLLSITRQTIHRWINEGKLARLKIKGNAYLFREAVEKLRRERNG
ncbi:hypothetical protein DRH14_03070 [Candidatus Shapirobacteria bacterium]|nr:MAG: hypothetical protein DRH14_03070 [Candidatus Shapirobacteria bacterium]